LVPLLRSHLVRSGHGTEEIRVLSALQQ
jgi:hypothetical protein